MAQTSAGSVPIPPPKKDDSEDVAWALSTAEAMYARGDRSDALKWLRRAAESASEAEADDRALELAKAAADLAAIVGPVSMTPPPPPPAMQPSAPPPVRPSAAPPPVRPSAAPPAVAPPVMPVAAPSRPSTPPARPSSPAPARMVGTAPKPAARAPVVVTPVAPRTTEPARRTGRRSRPDIEIARPPDESTQTQTMQDMAVPLQTPKRRGRASKPAAEEVAPPPPPPTPRAMPQPSPSSSGPLEASDPEAWPTQSLSGHDLPDDSQEKTRIGVPAYEASARMASEATDAPSTPALDEPRVRPAQAIRVVLWRAGDGLRVAPAGTRVTAITVDAVLVALDPGTDLAAWLSGK